MFKRIIYDHWTAIVPFVGFFITFAIFVFATIRTVLMKADQREHLAALPLDDDNQNNSNDQNPQATP